MDSEFLKPCDLEKIRNNWSPKFGRMGVDPEEHQKKAVCLDDNIQGLKSPFCFLSSFLLYLPPFAEMLIIKA